MQEKHHKVDYFIAGAQKGGTTALFQKMSANVQFIKHENKELHFFDNDKLNGDNPNYTKLHKNLELAEAHQFIGDATPIYMY